jgi:hypothetical protein
MSGKYSKLLIFWGVIFFLSLFFIITGPGASFQDGMDNSNGIDKPTVDPEEGDKPEETAFNWGMLLAMVTTVASAGGFIATTYFAIREDRRDTAMHQLQIANLKREIERKDLEISKLRQEREQDPPP